LDKDTPIPASAAFDFAPAFREESDTGSVSLGQFEAMYETLFAESLELGEITSEERERLNIAAAALGLDAARVERLEQALLNACEARAEVTLVDPEDPSTLADRAPPSVAAPPYFQESEDDETQERGDVGDGDNDGDAAARAAAHAHEHEHESAPKSPGFEWRESRASLDSIGDAYDSPEPTTQKQDRPALPSLPSLPSLPNLPSTPSALDEEEGPTLARPRARAETDPIAELHGKFHAAVRRGQIDLQFRVAAVLCQKNAATNEQKAI
jgi:hypothetical protein